LRKLQSAIKFVLVAGFLSLASISAHAGPPFLTDDPDPVPYHHWELYGFVTQDISNGTKVLNAPAAEINNGVAPNTQVHFILPETTFSADGYSASTVGDAEVGVKYRFATETKNRPEIGMFPLLELPSGSAAEGTGNGRAWTKLPMWLEKDWGPWVSYGGGGIALNSAPGQRNYGFGGVLVQRTLNPKLSLGGEIYLQGASVEPGQMIPDAPSSVTVSGTRASAIWNFGGTYNFTPDFSLLFSAGHSFEGDDNNVLYLALYRIWGPGTP